MQAASAAAGEPEALPLPVRGDPAAWRAVKNAYGIDRKYTFGYCPLPAIILVWGGGSVAAAPDRGC